MVKPQFVRYDASKGLIVCGSNDGNQFNMNRAEILEISGQIRNLELFGI